MTKEKTKKILGKIINKNLETSETIDDFDKSMEMYLGQLDDRLRNAVKRYDLQFMIDNGRTGFEKTLKADVPTDEPDLPKDKDVKELFDSMAKSPDEISEELKISEILTEEELLKEEDLVQSLEEVAKQAQDMDEETEEVVEEPLTVEEIPVDEFEDMPELEPEVETTFVVEDYDEKNFLQDYKQYGLTVSDLMHLKVLMADGKDNLVAKAVATKVFGKMSEVMNGYVLEDEIEQFYNGLEQIGVDEKVMEAISNYKDFLGKAKDESGYNHKEMMELIEEEKQKHEKEKTILKTKEHKLNKEKESVKDLKSKLKKEKDRYEKMSQGEELVHLEESLELEEKIYGLEDDIYQREEKMKILDSEVAKKSYDRNLLDEEIKLKEKMVNLSEPTHEFTFDREDIENMFSSELYQDLESKINYFGAYKIDLRGIISTLQLKGMKADAEILNILMENWERVPLAESLPAIGLDERTMEVTANKLAALENARQNQNNLHKQAVIFTKNNLGKQKYLKAKKDILEYLDFGKYDDLHEVITKTVDNVESQLDDLTPNKRVAYENGLRLLKAFDEQYVVPLSTADIADLPYGEAAQKINELMFLNARNNTSKERIVEILTRMHKTGAEEANIEYLPGEKITLNKYPLQGEETPIGEMFKAYDRIK